MDKRELENLQRYIGKRSRGQTDEEVIIHIEKIDSKECITQEEWGKLLFPICANVDILMMQYVHRRLKKIETVRDYVLHTVRFRQNSIEYQLKQVEILRMLVDSAKEKKLINILNDALVNAAWFGECEAVKFLIDRGADIEYMSSNGKSILELSQNAIDKFDDYRVYNYISDLL